MTDLFPTLPVSLSPFLAWKERHKVETHFCDGVDGPRHWISQAGEPWTALAPGITVADVARECARLEDEGLIAYGATEEDACINLARIYHLPWLHGEML